MLWGGNDCGQDEGHEIPKATIRTADYCGSKQTEDCGIFQQFGLLDAIIYIKLNLVFPWQKQNSTKSALWLQVGLTIRTHSKATTLDDFRTGPTNHTRRLSISIPISTRYSTFSGLLL